MKRRGKDNQLSPLPESRLQPASLPKKTAFFVDRKWYHHLSLSSEEKKAQFLRHTVHCELVETRPIVALYDISRPKKVKKGADKATK